MVVTVIWSPGVPVKTKYVTGNMVNEVLLITRCDLRIINTRQLLGYHILNPETYEMKQS
jgi:hypothetical protein